MIHLPVGPTHLDQLAETRTPAGWRSWTLQSDPEVGAATRLILIPDGHIGSPTKTRQFEHHTLQEEIFILEGAVAFEDYYTVPRRSYINHPPYWLHPAVQRYEGDTTMLLKINRPVDFFNEPIPDDWDGVESFSANPDLPPVPEPRGEAITCLRFMDADWRTTANGANVAVLWTNPADGWVTSLLDLPSGWTGTLPGGQDGEELYAVAGSAWSDALDLSPGSYYCDPGGTPVTQPVRSDGGFFAIRWTRSNPLG